MFVRLKVMTMNYCECEEEQVALKYTKAYKFE